MMYVIEQGIPLPAARRGCKPGGPPKSEVAKHLDRLEVGESFLMSEHSAFNTAQCYGKLIRPKRFSFRKVAGGWRVWRVE